MTLKSLGRYPQIAETWRSFWRRQDEANNNIDNPQGYVISKSVVHRHRVITAAHVLQQP